MRAVCWMASLGFWALGLGVGGVAYGQETSEVAERLPNLPLGSVPHGMVLFDRLEYGYGVNSNALWDASAWVGGDSDRFRLRTEGSLAAPGPLEMELEVQAMYSRLVAPFWEIQAGLRVDYLAGADGGTMREFVVIGVEGTAPHWFDVEIFAYMTHELEVSFRLAVTYDMLITQRLVAQLRAESNIAIQEVAAIGVGQGLNDVGLGLRLRYSISRQFAPYLGVSWEQRVFGTAALARARDENPMTLTGVAGVRFWF